MELPIAFETRMRALLGAEYLDFYAALMNEDAVKGLRVNTEKVSAECFEKNAPFALERIPYVPNGYVVSDEVGAGRHPYHHAGAYYMQDPGAMSTVAAIPRAFWEREGLRILDLCAAPGGKTTQLASLCASGRGVVFANEYNSARSKILGGNVERMGLGNVCVTNLDSRIVAETYPQVFDLVVVDAPCSGEGMFRKNDRAVTEWNEENVRACAARQRLILENAAKTVAAGGYLLYSTCTYSVEENEGVVEDFLKTHPRFSICACDPSVMPFTADGVDLTGRRAELALCRRFYPHRARGEGQFVALLRCDEGDARIDARKACDGVRRLEKNDRAVADAFMKETLGHTLPRLCNCGGNTVILPDADGIEELIPRFGVIALGTALGEIRKGRLVPHHHYFMALGAHFLSRVLLDADGEAARKYIAGEEIACEGAVGMSAVLLRLGDEALTLGGGKAVDGRLKNYYPKGLRSNH